MHTKFFYTALLAAGLASSSLVAAQNVNLPLPQISGGRPVACSGGFQDSACNTTLLRSAQTPPTCASTDGWVTVTPAK